MQGMHEHCFGSRDGWVGLAVNECALTFLFDVGCVVGLISLARWLVNFLAPPVVVPKRNYRTGKGSLQRQNELEDDSWSREVARVLFKWWRRVQQCEYRSHPSRSSDPTECTRRNLSASAGSQTTHAVRSSCSSLNGGITGGCPNATEAEASESGIRLRR